MWSLAELLRMHRKKPVGVWITAEMKYGPLNKPEEAVLAVMTADRVTGQKSTTILLSPWMFSNFFATQVRSYESIIVVRDWRGGFIEADPDLVDVTTEEETTCFPPA